MRSKLQKDRVTSMSVTDYLRRPYMRSVIPQDDGSFHAEIVELPGCIALGETPSEAYSRLEEVAEGWFEAAISAGQAIPDAMEQSDFSGKTVVRMPRSLHRKAALFAQREGVSLNQYIVSCIAEGIGGSTKVATAPVSITINVPPVFSPRMEAGATTQRFVQQMKSEAQYARN